MHIKGSDLRRMRLRAKLTTYQMATLAGLKSRKSYENWERGVCTPNVNQYLTMAQACGVDIDNFLLLAKDPPRKGIP